MSEFECKRGHIWGVGRGMACPVCGSPAAYMDGLSNRQLRALEEKGNYQPYVENEERKDESQA